MSLKSNEMHECYAIDLKMNAYCVTEKHHGIFMSLSTNFKSIFQFQLCSEYFLVFSRIILL